MTPGIFDKAETLKQLTGTITKIPEGKCVTKIEFGEDVDGNIRETKYYENDTLLFTITFSNAGSVVTTWSMTRS